MPRGDEVTAAEMDALLAELQDVGGTITAEARPYTSTQTRGTAGTTSILREQHHYATHSGRGNIGGPLSPSLIVLATVSQVSSTPAGAGGCAPVAGARRISGSSTNAYLVGTPVAAAGRRLPGGLNTVGSTSNSSSSAGAAGAGGAMTTNGGFSSYASTGLTSAELRSERHTAAPLGVRLAPLSLSSTTQSNGGNGGGGGGHSPSPSPGPGGGILLTPTKNPLKGKKTTSPPKSALKSSGPVTLDLNPLPALTGGAVGISLEQMPAPKREFSFRDNYRQCLSEAQEEASAANGNGGSASQKGSPGENNGASSTSNNSSGRRESNPVEPAYREANFLPIMCARYLNPAGLTPPSRWGHTLTAVGGASSASWLLMFGGMELNGAESNTLARFDTSAIAWEPGLVVPPSSTASTLGSGTGGGGGVGLVTGQADPPPAPRYNHAACAYEDRYLIVHGGAAKNATMLFGDIHLYDTQTHKWQSLWSSSQAAGGAALGPTMPNKNEPAPRFGHTMVVRDDRLYIFGGKVLKVSGASLEGSEPTKVTTAVANADIYVFSLNSLRWKKRIRASASCASGTLNSPSKKSSRKKATTKEASEAGQGESSTDPQPSKTPAARTCHAATIKGGTFYINGGADGQGNVLADTWFIDLSNPSGGWCCLHRGDSADAMPRERHELFACGEALLVVGGCSTSQFAPAISGKFNNFVSVLPTVGPAAGACWIPVAMGNVSIVAPHKKNFAAAFLGGFVYVFGGMCGIEPATNTMIRFLAADGYVAADARATQEANDEAIRGLLRRLCERPPIPHDIVTVADVISSSSSGGDGGTTAVNLFAVDASGAATREARFHKPILAQRAPKLLVALQACRSDVATVALRGNQSMGSFVNGRRLSQQGQSNASAGGAQEEGSAGDEGDVVDALLQQRQPGACSGGGNGSVSSPPSSHDSNHSSNYVGQVTTYYTAGNSRVAGLPHALTAEELCCLAGYVYWGGLPAAFKRLLQDEEGETTAAATTTTSSSHAVAAGEDEEQEKDEDGGDGKSVARSRKEIAASRAHLKSILHALKQASEDYELKPLGALVDALLAGSRKQLQKAQEKSCVALRKDAKSLLETGNGATCTVLFADPHTKQQSAHALHPALLMSASSFFLELLRPLYTGEKTTFQVGPVAAKLVGGGNNATTATNASSTSSAVLFSSATSVSKRAVLIGPVAVPKLAIQPILQYLYTQQLSVPREVAFEVMLGAHKLGLPLLQAYCEAIVAREEVTYDSCCTFYFLARKHSAALLEETSLLTAVSGYAEVRHQPGYVNLSMEDKKSIDAVAAELGSSSWVPPPQPSNEMKSSETYAARWNAASQ